MDPKISDVEKSTKRSSMPASYAACKTFAVPIMLTCIVRTGSSITVSMPAMAAAWTTVFAPFIASRSAS